MTLPLCNPETKPCEYHASYRLKTTVKKRDHDDMDEEAKLNPDDGVKPETKDEDSDGDSCQGPKSNAIAGEEADVRDVIYNLENLGAKEPHVIHCHVCFKT